jgi:hypothetical protein
MKLCPVCGGEMEIRFGMFYEKATGDRLFVCSDKCGRSIGGTKVIEFP